MSEIVRGSVPLPIGFFKTSGISYDSEVLAWESAIVAAGKSLSTTTKNAADTCVKAIKAVSGLRAKLLRFYLFAGTGTDVWLIPIFHDVGPSADTHGVGTWVYNETGSGGGVYCTSGNLVLTGVNANDSSMGLDNTHFGAYITQGAAGIQMGAGRNSGMLGAGYFHFDFAGNKTNYTMWNASSDIPNISDSLHHGHYVISRGGSGAFAYRNGSQVGTNASPGGAVPTAPSNIAYFNATLNGVDWSGGETQSHYGALHFGTDLTSSDVSSLYNAIQAFNVTLTRNP